MRIHQRPKIVQDDVLIGRQRYAGRRIISNCIIDFESSKPEPYRKIFQMVIEGEIYYGVVPIRKVENSESRHLWECMVDHAVLNEDQTEVSYDRTAYKRKPWWSYIFNLW
jgi:hypothetical protein